MYDGYNGKMRGDQVSCTLTSQCGYTGNRGGQQVVLPVLTPDRIEKKQNGRRIKENGEPAFTLTSEDRHGVAIGVLRTVRSEYGKEIRKDYESGNLDISRHEFLEHEIREDGVANTIDSVTKDNLLGIGIEGNYMPSGHSAGNIISQGGVSPTVMENHGTVSAVTVRVKEATKQGYAVARGGQDSINLSMPESRTRRGRVGVGMANTLDCGCEQGVAVEVDGEVIKEEHPGMFVQLSNGAVVYAVWYPKYECYVAIRKLTPRECFRLQGWEDEYFDRAEFVNSDSQLYKQAGNGVTVNVVELIGRRLAEIERGKNGQENSG